MLMKEEVIFGQEKGNKKPDKVAGDNVVIYSDPQLSEAPAPAFSGEGIPVYKTEWITNGILKNLWEDTGSKLTVNIFLIPKYLHERDW